MVDHPPPPPITAVARDREVEGDLFHWDMGEGLGFRPGTFDGVISISALQWLCNADRKSHHPPQRLYRFFSSLYACMVSELIAHIDSTLSKCVSSCPPQARGTRAVFQFYPENPAQVHSHASNASPSISLEWTCCVDGADYAAGDEGRVHWRCCC